jgi:hypothetical protein
MVALAVLKAVYGNWAIKQQFGLFTAEYQEGNAVRYLVAHSTDQLADALKLAGDNPLVRSKSGKPRGEKPAQVIPFNRK